MAGDSTQEGTVSKINEFCANLEKVGSWFSLLNLYEIWIHTSCSVILYLVIKTRLSTLLPNLQTFGVKGLQ